MRCRVLGLHALPSATLLVPLTAPPAQAAAADCRSTPARVNIAVAGGVDVAKLKRLIEQARTQLERDEPVFAAVLGSYEARIMGTDSVRGGVLIATDRRVVFFAKTLTGHDLESYPYMNISSFEQGKNMMGHNITLYASGNRVHMKWIHSSKDWARFIATIKSAMNAKHRVAQPAPPPPPILPAAPPVPSPPPVPAAPDVINQLKRLGELRDAGVLTADEFDAKKAELLARL